VAEREPSLAELLALLFLLAVVGATATLVVTVYNFVANAFEELAGASLSKLIPDAFPVYSTAVATAATLIVFAVFMKIGRALRRV